MSKESPKISRREFLRSIGIGVAGVALAGCEPVERAIKKIRETVEVKPTAANTPMATEKPIEPMEELATNTPSPTEAPTKTPIQEATPTSDLEATRVAQAKLWEKRTFILGKGTQTGGISETNEELLLRQEIFESNVYQELTAMDISPKNSWLLIGTQSPWLEKNIHPAQMDDSRFVALLGTKKGGQMQMLCFSEELANEGVNIEMGCGGAKPDSQIWGKDYKTIISAGKPEERQAILVGPDDNCFSLSVGALGITDIFTPAMQDENENWVVDEKRLEEEGEKKGFLVTAGQDGKVASFMLDYDNVPSIPEEGLELKDSIDAHLDIINGIIYVWNLEEVKGEEDKTGFYYCGKYSLETGEWEGKTGWEKYESLFENISTPTPEPTPTKEVKTPASWEINPRYEEEYTNGETTIKLITDESLPEGIKIGIKPDREGDLLSFLQEKIVDPLTGKKIFVSERGGTVLPQEKEIDWSKPIEAVWRGTNQGIGIVMRKLHTGDSGTFTFLRREDGGLRVIFYVSLKRFTERGRFNLPAEVEFSGDIAFLEFLFSNPQFMKGKMGWTSDELGAWQETSGNGNCGGGCGYDKRLADYRTPESTVSSSVTVFK